jgi:hypothetical protein
VEGLTAPTSTAIAPDGTLYVTNFGTTAGRGQVLRVVPSGPAGAAGLASLQGTWHTDTARNDDDGGILGGAADVLS